MNQNLVELVGKNLDIKDLVRYLKTSSWRIIEEGGKYYLTSEKINELSEFAEIMAICQSYLKILNSAVKILITDHEEVMAGTLITIDENGKRVAGMTANPISIKFRTSGQIRFAEDKSTVPMQTMAEKWLELSETYPSVRDALFFFSEITWWNLYKIFEIIDEDLEGNRKIYSLGETDKLRLFKQTSQSRKAIGDLARHASTKYKPPKKIMSLDEAYFIISSLFKKWVDSKEKYNNPHNDNKA